MLKRIVLRNFVNFKEAQSLEFENDENDGVFMFVAANGCGKSSMFEAVRRCSDLYLNKSLSSRDPSKESIVMCLFQKLDDHGCSRKMVSYYIAWNVKGSSRVTEVKIIIQESETRIKAGMAWSDGTTDSSGGKWKCYNKQTLTDNMRETLFERAKTLISPNKKNGGQSTDQKGYINRGIDIFLNRAAEIIKREHESREEDSGSSPDLFEKRFSKFVSVEFLFQYRGLSLIQSSDQMMKNERKTKRKSKKRNKPHRKPNGKSFIIKDFLHDKRGTKYDKILVKEIFKLITSSEDHKFIEEDGSIIIKTGRNRAKLLKAPEGIVEAKFLSVLLAKKSVGTLLIEEPDRGMHKNFTDIVINRVFLEKRFIRERTLILTTHNRDFLTPASLLKTTFFSRRLDGSCETKRLRPTHGRKSLHFISSPAVSSIFFAKYSLIVEGKSDATFVETIKKILIKEENMLSIFVQDKNIREAFKNFLATLNIVELGGKKAISLIEPICEDLGIERRRFFLLDGDAKDAINLNNNDYFLWNPKCKLPTKSQRVTSSKKRKQIRKGSLEHAILETVQLHVEGYDLKGNCTLKQCKAKVFLQQLKEKEKDIFSKVETDNDIEEFIKTLLHISLTNETCEIWRFINFIKNKSASN